MNIRITRADYSDPDQGKELAYLLDTYAQDPMGGGKPLAQHVIDNIATALSRLPHAFSILGYVDNQPAGLVTCFEAFSTFKCKPLVNIHDVMVLKEFRGHGLSQRMLSKVEAIAKSRGCCKLTLEVLSNNEAAKHAYKKYGFNPYELDPQAGSALFWDKAL